MPAAVFLDRDGVIIRHRPDYVRDWSQVELLPGALEALRRLRDASCRVAVVTNQSIVGRGLVAPEVVDDINRRLAAVVEDAGGRVEVFAVCPHTPWDGCECRKPRPGLILEAARKLDVAAEHSWMVGDTLTDIEAGLAAGCQPLLVMSGAPVDRQLVGSDVRVVADLSSAVDRILAS